MTFDAFTTDAKFANEKALLQRLASEAALSTQSRAAMSHRAGELVQRIRDGSDPTLMEHFLAEFGLSSREGVALMCLAEAMLRVPDAETIDALIEDKIAPSDWGAHMRSTASMLVNASTWALMLTGRVLDDEPAPGLAGVLRGAIRRLGEPVIRVAVGRAMKEMGRQFVLGETIDAALGEAREMEAKGYSYSYDMLGEAAMTATDAARYAASYADAITAIAGACDGDDLRANPGISIKLSALHPRYEVAQEARVIEELVPVVLRLAQQAKAAGMGLNIDAEEQARLVLSLKVIEAVMADNSLAGWDGFGVVVQAYGKRAGLVIDWLHDLATQLDRRIMVRLVKGAYWDTEMKLAQVEGHPGFPLFTSKTATDVSYIALAKKLLGMADRIYPQFATHNAHTVAAVLEMADGQDFEFQRLHGMGERLHDLVLHETSGRCRVYAPVGAHRDLLAYLVRRLLENGANSSFVHQIVDEDVSPEEIASDPFAALGSAQAPSGLLHPKRIFGDRENSKGFDLTDSDTLDLIRQARQANLPRIPEPATVEDVRRACGAAIPWAANAEDRAATLRRAADLYEENFGVIFATLAREAGKTWLDAVGELREAVDFLRYYADAATDAAPLGTVAAISPWNFPLAIFTGQISAALAAGNAVLAKPAEQTPRIATLGVALLHEAGVPRTALQLLAGDGGTVGAAITSNPQVDGVVFTGSTETAKIIQRAMSENLAPGAPLIAETGGLNAMIVDSTALPEQAVRDIVASAFQSAGQRCSALRCLYLQEDVAPHILDMIKGAMDELTVGDPWELATDVGPVIDASAQAEISAYVDGARAAGNVIHEIASPKSQGAFVSPVMVQVSGIEALPREIFGPVLHIATFAADEIDKVIGAVNASGYGLTFGLHSRIDDRVQLVADGVHAGNVYVNRNQIGAVVGSQPFGGEGLSGTGPKAGGPLYVPHFARGSSGPIPGKWETPANLEKLQSAIDASPRGLFIKRQTMPGPTGEANTLQLVTRGPILCLGPGAEAAAVQLAQVEALGGTGLAVDGHLEPAQLQVLSGFAGVLYCGEDARDHASALAKKPGPILPLITGAPVQAQVAHERHLCVDTTAAGGNAALLAG